MSKQEEIDMISTHLYIARDRMAMVVDSPELSYAINAVSEAIQFVNTLENEDYLGEVYEV